MNNSKIVNIDSSLNSHLNIFKNKIIKYEYVPSSEEFSDEVNKILSENVLMLPHSKDKVNPSLRRVPMSQFKVFCQENEAETLRYATACINRFFTNPIITTYLTRREVAVSELGIPVYSKAERTVYNFTHMPYIPFRNPNSKHCPNIAGIFAWGQDYAYAPDWQKDYAKSYEKLARAIFGFPRADARINIPNYNAFNILVIDKEIQSVLTKNKHKVEQYKNANPETCKLKGIHYLDYTLDCFKIIQLIHDIKSGNFILEDFSCNIFIFGFDDLNGHGTCGTLVVHRENSDNNSIAFELFIFDSKEMEEPYVLKLKEDFQESLVDNPLWDLSSSIPLTYIAYDLQVDGTNDYEEDYSCVLYSTRTMNKLVEIIGFSENSALRDRLLGHKGLNYIDTQEDRVTYLNELAQALPNFFDYDSTSNSYTAKSFKDRQMYNIAARWDLGRRFLKNYIRQYALDHGLLEPIFKLPIQQ